MTTMISKRRRAAPARCHYRKSLARLRADQRGLTTVEYAIVLCLIAAVVVGTWQKFGAGLKTRIASSTTQIDSKMDDAIGDFH